jgi:hypothetical protein
MSQRDLVESGGVHRFRSWYSPFDPGGRRRTCPTLSVTAKRRPELLTTHAPSLPPAIATTPIGGSESRSRSRPAIKPERLAGTSLSRVHRAAARSRTCYLPPVETEKRLFALFAKRNQDATDLPSSSRIKPRAPAPCSSWGRIKSTWGRPAILGPLTRSYSSPMALSQPQGQSLRLWRKQSAGSGKFPSPIRFTHNCLSL